MARCAALYLLFGMVRRIPWGVNLQRVDKSVILIGRERRSQLMAIRGNHKLFISGVGATRGAPWKGFCRCGWETPPNGPESFIWTQADVSKAYRKHRTEVAS